MGSLIPVTVLVLSLIAVATSSPLWSKNGTSCGLPSIPPDMVKIVGGKDAIPYSWPWQVALMMETSWFGPYQFCSGTIIADEWVMTAGHCFYGTHNVAPYTVRMGVYNKNKINETGERVLNISEIHVHPKYDPQTTHFDITLLKLATPVNFTDHITPICVPNDQDEALPAEGTGVYVTGWGDTSEWGTDSDTLKQVIVPIANITECKVRYEDLGAVVYEDTMFCAGLEEGGKDSCQGDSGGPVVYKDAESGRWRQLGITSWGKGCAEAKYFGVYSKVAAYVDFIREYVNDV